MNPSRMPSLDPMRRGPRLRQAIAPIRKLIGKCFEKFFQTDHWNIGLVDAPIHRFLEPGFTPSVLWLLPEARARFAADPFGIETDDGLVILFEQLHYLPRRGVIASLLLKHGQPSCPRVEVDNGEHMSYPYVVQFADECYFLPETFSKRELVLYKLDRAGRGWT